MPKSLAVPAFPPIACSAYVTDFQALGSPVSWRTQHDPVGRRLYLVRPLSRLLRRLWLRVQRTRRIGLPDRWRRNFASGEVACSVFYSNTICSLIACDLSSLAKTRSSHR